MAKYYKLIDACTAAEMFNIPHRENGKNVYKFYTLYPGVKYSEHADDPLFVKTLREDCHKQIPYSEDRKRLLEKAGVRFEEKMCRTCGGMSKKLDVWLVEVVE